MNIVIGTIVLALLAHWVWRRLGTDERRTSALVATRRMLLVNMPRLVLALISAGLFAELLPEEMVRQYLGETAGFRGVLLGAALGILTPGGAFVSFALAAGAAAAGATQPALIAYLTAWALFSLTKIVAEELAFLGWRFIGTRVAFTAPIPVATGTLALLV